MLARLRSKTLQKHIFIFLSIVIIPGFIAWGTVSFVSAQRKTPVMEIAGEKITPDFLEEMKKEVVMGYFLVYGQKVYEHIEDTSLAALAMERIILYKQALRKKYTITDADIVRYIKKMFSVNDTFKKAAYDNFLKTIFTMPRLRYTTETFEGYLRKELMINALRDEIFKGITADKKDILQAFLEENEQVSFAFALVKFQPIRETVTVSRPDIEKRFTETKEEYTIPPQAEIVSLFIPQKTQAPKNSGTITEKKIRQLLAAGKGSLEAVAQQLKLSVEQETISMSDPVGKAGYYPPINQKIFSAEDKSLIGPLVTPEGYIVAKKLRAISQRIPALPEVEADIKAVLQQEAAEQKAQTIAKQIIEQFKKGASPEKVGAAFPKTLTGESGFISYSQREPVKGTLAINPSIKNILLNLIEKEVTPVAVPYNDEGLLVIKVLGKKTTKKFEDVQDTYREKVLLQKRIIAYITYLQQLSADLKIKVYAEPK